MSTPPPQANMPSGHPPYGPAPTPPPRPAVLDLTTGAWIAATLVFCVVIILRAAVTPPSSLLLTLVIGAAFTAVLVYGCWRFRSGSTGWRVFFTLVSGCYALLTPFGFVDPTWGPAQRAFSVLVAAFGITGIIGAWLPRTNQYFRDLTHYTRSIKAAQYQQFLRTNPPPESIRRKMMPPHQPPPHNRE